MLRSLDKAETDDCMLLPLNATQGGVDPQDLHEGLELSGPVLGHCMKHFSSPRVLDTA